MPPVRCLRTGLPGLLLLRMAIATATRPVVPPQRLLPGRLSSGSLDLLSRPCCTQLLAEPMHTERDMRQQEEKAPAPAPAPCAGATCAVREWRKGIRANRYRFSASKPWPVPCRRCNTRRAAGRSRMTEFLQVFLLHVTRIRLRIGQGPSAAVPSKNAATRYRFKATASDGQRT